MSAWDFCPFADLPTKMSALLRRPADEDTMVLTLLSRNWTRSPGGNFKELRWLTEKYEFCTERRHFCLRVPFARLPTCRQECRRSFRGQRCRAHREQILAWGDRAAMVFSFSFACCTNSSENSLKIPRNGREAPVSQERGHFCLRGPFRPFAHSPTKMSALLTGRLPSASRRRDSFPQRGPRWFLPSRPRVPPTPREVPLKIAKDDTVASGRIFSARRSG